MLSPWLTGSGYWETVSRIAQTLQVPPKMYRHFAVVTVVLTLIIALFADGENREAIGNELDSQRQQSALHQAEAEKFGPKKVAANEFRQRNGSGWGSEGPVEPAGSISGPSEIRVTRENGDVERAGNLDFGVIGPGPQLQKVGGTITNTGPLRQPSRRKPTAAERARLEQAGFEAAGNGSTPRT